MAYRFPLPGFPLQQVFTSVGVGFPVMPGAAYTVPILPTGMLTSMGARPFGGQRRKMELPYEVKYPITTVFVGNITEKASNDLVKQILSRCGIVSNWKRIQGSNGKYQGFGFCEFEHPECTLRALRLLHGFLLGEKKLNVRADEKTRRILQEYINKRRAASGYPPIAVDGKEIPPADDMQKSEDMMYVARINDCLNQHRKMLESGEDGEITVTSSATGFGMSRGHQDEIHMDTNKEDYIAQQINYFRETYKDDKDLKPTPSAKKSKEDEVNGGGAEQQPRGPAEQESSTTTTTASDVNDATIIKNEDKTAVPTIELVSTRTLSRERSRDYNRRAPPRHRSPTLVSRRSRSASRERGEVVDRRKRDRADNRLRQRSPPRHKRTRRSRERSTRSDDERSESSADDSDDDDEAYEKKRLQKKLCEKEIAFQERLRKWETRERKKLREYEKDALKVKQKRKEEMKEAKKLKEFLEDYDDERDDPKYYKGSAVVQRRNIYEKEKENDSKDRQREKDELEEIRKRLVAEGYLDPDKEIIRIQQEQEQKLRLRLRGSEDSESPPIVLSPPPATTVHTPIVIDTPSSVSDPIELRHESDCEEMLEVHIASPSEDLIPRAPDARINDGAGIRFSQQEIPKFELLNNAAGGIKPMGFAGLKLGGTTSVPVKMKPAFEPDEEEEKPPTRKLVPIDYGEDDGGLMAKIITAEEKKRMIKDLIERIPTSKDELFAFPVRWEQVDKILIEKRLKPWVNKKITDYIGEEEQSLVEFVCQKVQSHTSPTEILEDVTMILDDEAEVFVVKMWRLLIYELEAKKMGLVKAESTT